MSKRIRIAILLLCASLFSASCGKYNPSLYPSYDPLRPGTEVQILGFVGLDGKAVDDKGAILTEGVVVNQAFMLWVYDLKQEILKLRKGKL